MINLYKCKKKHFGDIYKNKDIVCFGAGDELRKIYTEYNDIASQISFIIDNNKAGQYISINNTHIPIVSPEEIDIQKGRQIGVLSTIYYADQMVKQLDLLEKYNDFSLFVPYFFEEDDIEFDFLSQHRCEIIPRIIHYCWFGDKDLPDQFKKNIDTWKKYCPDYRIIKWDEDNYDIKKNKYMEQAYRAGKWGFVPDYARLDIINTYGGIYLDTDVEILRPWDELLVHNLFCGFESDDFVAFGLGFGGVSNNSILEEMMLQYDNLNFYNDDGSLNLTASPIFQTEIMKKHGLICNGKMQITDEYAVFPAQYFAPVNPVGKGKPSEISFSIHQYAASWCECESLEKKNRAMESISFVQKRIKMFL